MADQGGDWTSPSGGPARDPEPPRYGERVPGWTAPSEPPVAPAPVGYAPPPRPGLIPLHPLSFGQLLGAAFQTIRYNPRAAVAPALLVALVQTGLVTLVTYGIGYATIDRLERARSTADRTTIALGGAAEGLVAFVAVALVAFVASALLQGMLTRVVADGALGRRPTAGQALRAAARRFWPLLGFAVLLGLIQFVLVILVGAAAAGLFALGLGLTQQRLVAVGIAIAVAIPVGLGLIVVYVFFAVRFALAPSAILLERRGVFRSMGRSWRLTRKSFWRTFGLVALVTVMVSFAGQIVSVPFSVIGGALGGVLYPNAGDSLTGSLPAFLISTLPSLIVGVLVSGIGQIAQVAAVVLVYLDRRMRTEGLDIELQRVVEQGGDDDPYERIG